MTLHAETVTVTFECIYNLTCHLKGQYWGKMAAENKRFFFK